MTIPQLNAEIRRLEPLSNDLWKVKEAIAKDANDKWLAAALELDRLKKERAELVEQITSDTAQATV